MTVARVNALAVTLGGHGLTGRAAVDPLTARPVPLLAKRWSIRHQFLHYMMMMICGGKSPPVPVVMDGS